MSHDSTDNSLFSHAREGVDAPVPDAAVTANLTFSDNSAVTELAAPPLA